MPIFEKRETAQILNEVIIDGCKRKNFSIIAFCILPDHAHLLIQKKQPFCTSRLNAPHTSRLSPLTSRLTVAAMVPNKKPSAGAVTRAVATYSDLLYYIKSFAFYRLRKELGLTFSPWQPRYNFRIVDSESRFENTLNYILHNYKKHHLPKRYGWYPYLFKKPSFFVSIN